MTPEAKVKKKVVDVLKKGGAYYFSLLLVAMGVVGFLILLVAIGVCSLLLSVRQVLTNLLHYKKQRCTK